MSNLHIAGSDLRFDLTILRDGVPPGAVDPLSTATLRYKAPDGTTGTWAATIDDAEAGKVHHDVAATSNSTAGKWIVWCDAVFSGGGKLVTESVEVPIYQEGMIIT